MFILNGIIDQAKSSKTNFAEMVENQSYFTGMNRNEQSYQGGYNRLTNHIKKCIKGDPV